MSILINICLFGAIFGTLALVLTEAISEDKYKNYKNV